MKDDPDLVFDEDFLESIENLKCMFDNLSSGEQEAKSSFDSTMLKKCNLSFRMLDNRRQRFAIDLQSSNGRLQYHIHGEYKSNMYSRDAVFLFSNTILFSFLS